MLTRAEEVRAQEQQGARSARRYPMPDGSVYTVTLSAAETGGERTEMEFRLPPGSVSPPAHIHPCQFDEFEVLEGTLDVTEDAAWRTLQAGEAISIPPGTLHTFRNSSPTAVRARCVHRPAMRFEQYLEHIHALMEARGIGSGKDPRVLIYLSLLALEYDDTVLSPRLRERLALKALAGLGRLLHMNTRVAARADTSQT